MVHRVLEGSVGFLEGGGVANNSARTATLLPECSRWSGLPRSPEGDPGLGFRV